MSRLVLRRPAAARLRRRRKPDRRPVVLGGAAATALVAAGLAAVRRRRGAGGGITASEGPTEQRAPVVPGPPSEAPVAEGVERTFTCACGQELRVQGEDRHRVYWLPDAAVSDPLLQAECPSCGRPLPREHEHPAPVADQADGPAAA